MWRAPSLTLRTRFMLVVLLGAVLPLGLLGYWLTRATERSGEELLRGRLEETLDRLVREMGVNWAGLRSNLLDLAAHPTVVSDVRDPEAPRAGAPADVRELYARLQDDITQVTLHDTTGAVLWEMAADYGPASYRARAIGPTLPVRLDFHAPVSGERLGTLDARVAVSSLLGSRRMGVVSSVLALFDANGTPVLPVSIAPDVIRRPQFDWADEPWVGVRRVATEPPVELVLVAPAGPFKQPFADAKRRGTLALLFVTLASLALVVLLTARITRSLRRLAHAADAVAGGDLDQKVPAEGGRELSRVARAFNAMTENLRHTLRRLTQQESLAAVGEFAASLAHEVRNPLSSIRLDLQLAEEKTADPGAVELVGRALRTVERLNTTVTGALQVARSGRIQREPLDLKTVVEAAMHSAEPEFHKRGVRLAASVNGAGTVEMLGDAAALEQVFLNLLLNAAQAMEGGGEARVTLERDGQSVLVSVEDDGHGIPQELHSQIFEPFLTTKSEGTGLGLATVQRIVAAHGGEVTVESPKEGGTIVTVHLPFQAPVVRP